MIESSAIIIERFCQDESGIRSEIPFFWCLTSLTKNQQLHVSHAALGT